MSTPVKQRPFYRKTCRRYNDAGHAHALTFSCFRRQPFLSRDRARVWFFESLAIARQNHNFAIWAYVVMPEHAHLLIYPRDDEYSISEILTDIKQPVTRRALKYVRQNAASFLQKMKDEQPNGNVAHRFWQRGGGYDRNLTKADTVHSTIQYIHANPVRRGLVDTPEDWPWSTAAYFAGRNDVPLRPDREAIPPRDH